MPIHLLKPDAAHGRRLPSGREVARILAAFFRRQRAEAVAALREGRIPDLSRWTHVMVEAILATGFFQRLLVQGAQQTLARIQQSRRSRGKRVSVLDNSNTGLSKQRKTAQFSKTVLENSNAGKSGLTFRRGFTANGGAFIEMRRKGIGEAFDVINFRVLEAARSLVVNFCAATNATATMEIADAYAALRVALAESYQAGEVAQSKLTDRVQALFADNRRAQSIALTESSRITHAGELMAARDSGESLRKEWLCSSDCCPLCRVLGEKGEIGLDEPFFIDPKGGPYAIIMHPPRHPHCMCSQEMVLA